MAKSRPSITEQAQAGANTIENNSTVQRIARGGARRAQDAPSVQDVRDAKPTKNAKPAKDTVPMERLNLKIPADIKEYLQAAAYRESSPKHIVSLTEYLCDLVRRDMELHKDD